MKTENEIQHPDPAVTLTRYEAQLLATFAYWTMAEVERDVIAPLLEKLGFPIPEGRTWPEGR